MLLPSRFSPHFSFELVGLLFSFGILLFSSYFKIQSYDQHVLKIFTRGLDNDSVVKMLPKHQNPSLNPQHIYKCRWASAWICSPSAGGQRMLTGQSVQLKRKRSKFRKRACLRKVRERGREIKASLPFCFHLHRHR